MKKKFIAYGSNAFLQSSKRIIEEANALNVFDQTQRYSFADLPLALKASPLFLDDRKGGFWIWKAYIIYDSLKKLNDRDILVYADAGCELIKNISGWENHFEQLNNHDALFFQYRDDKNYGWNAFNSKFNDSPKLKYWVKKNTIDHFQILFGNNDRWLEKNKLWAGFIFLKKTDSTLQLIKDWLDVMLFRPELVTDPLISERYHQNPDFSSHRHDQSILSIIVRYYETEMKIKILDEESEGDYQNQILKAARRVDKAEASIIKSIIKKTYYRIKK
ncbi:hypothetical protein [Epilithonimonas mollis]|uniref:Uncharacterized protein n=1 Tax=Epilithonimonas mollis TaxID=216903 RepID=A0A1M6R9B2_9FLAO|nr:hypothetical protein [Epilithonimonas mollis]SHK28897.1 hypothetical protein SAMN05444371_1748 [Epilithonimonas mollis]